ncbi:MAG: Bug family tripartite tricarboxylate transporter substrate binding protein [Pigmentiphaga sp.]
MTPNLLAALFCTSALALTGAAHADFPDKGRPITVVVGFTPGGGIDTQARAVAQKMAESLDTPVVVENRPGASTIVATQAVMRAKPDGYTLLYAPSSAMAQNPHTLHQANYDPFNDFTPISLAARGPLVFMAYAGLPVTNLRELIDYIKANPGKTSYASFGTGTSSHIVGEVFARNNGLDAEHIAYKGGSDAARDLLSGRVEYMIDAAPSGLTSAATGKARMLAVVAPERSKYMPDVPTVTEAGVEGLDLPSWTGFYGPKDIPADVVKALNEAIAKALSSPDLIRTFETGAYVPESSTPQAFDQITRDAHAQWGSLIQSAGIEKQ